MHSFFISYSRKDKDYAERIRTHLLLVDSGNDVFLDLFGIRTGEKWRQSLDNAIKNSRFFILLLSANSAASKNVKEEVLAVNRNEMKTGIRKLFVLRVDDVTIPDYMRDMQVATATGNFTIDFYNLLVGVLSKPSFYSVQHTAANDDETGYRVKLQVNAPAHFMRLIDMVEYRFDYEFKGNEDVEVVELVETSAVSIRKGFAVEFWTSESILVFIVIYLKSMQTVTFEYPLKVNGG